MNAFMEKEDVVRGSDTIRIGIWGFYIFSPMKLLIPLIRFQAVLALILFSCSALFADPNESDLSGSTAGLLQYREQQQSYTPSSLQSDAEPYIGDSPIIDSLYKVGPGDLFQIFIESSTIEKQVNSEGNIILNRIGVIHLQDLMLADAKKLILDRLQTAYKRSNCFVNLSRPKTIRIFVTGAVNAPGIYEIPGNYRLSDALTKAKNFSIFAQKGTVQIQSPNATLQTVNVGKFLSQGDLESNPYLTQGCVVRVPFLDYSKPWVTFDVDSSSSVVQLDSEETVQDVIIKAYSFYFPEPYVAVWVKEKNGNDTLLSPSGASSYRPGSGARIETLPTKQEVFVGGAVASPGFQTYHPDRKIIQYISRAGLISSSKVPANIDVIRKDGTRESVSIEDVLRPGDLVYVKQNFEEKFLLYTPVLLSFVSLTLALLTLKGL